MIHTIKSITIVFMCFVVGAAYASMSNDKQGLELVLLDF